MFRFAAAAAVCFSAAPAGAAPAIEACRVGLGGVAKPGCWTPIVVAASDAAGASARVIAPDVDGAAVVYPLPAFADGSSETRGVFRFGRRDAATQVQLLVDGNIVSSRRLALPDEAATLPSTNRVVAVVSAELPGWSAGFVAGERPTSVAEVPRASRLPTTPLGYDAVSLLVLSVDDAACYDGLGPQDARVAAILEWVRGGGRLLLVGSAAAETLVGNGGPLAPLLPGVWDGPLQLLDGSPLERFAGADTPLGASRRTRLAGYRIADGRGEPLASVGDDAVPLVLRSREGFGEVAVVAMSLSAGPLAEWPATPRLVARAAGLESQADGPQSKPPSRLISRGYSDLAGALHQQLGRGFPGVAVAPMLAFVAVALGYLALIGPGDYLLVRRVFRRSVAAWLTLPAVAVTGSLGAAWMSGWLGGVGDKVNQLEVVDFDLASGRARGVLWAQAFCPRASRHNVSLDCRWPSGTKAQPERSLITWLGMPGGGIGGVDRGAGSLLSPASEYATTGGLDRLLGLPVLGRSTKAIACRWTGSFNPSNSPPVAATLASAGPGILSGVITNRTGADLADCWLAYGEWAWRLGSVEGGDTHGGDGEGDSDRNGAGPGGASPGGTLSLDTARAPIKLTTLLRRDYLSLSADDRSARRLDPQKLSLDALLQLVLLADAAGGVNATGLPSDYYERLDLSRDLGHGLAVLVARPADGARRSRLVTNAADAAAEWGAASPRDRVLYRFVLPVQSGR